MTASLQITDLLVDWSNGDEIALEKLIPLVEAELNRLARRQLRRLRPGNTLQTKALINETYFQLVNQKEVHWQNRYHFFGIAAKLMRRVLLNYLRDQRREKRGGAYFRVSISEADGVFEARADELIALDDALEKFALVDERKCRIVELKFFGGLNVDEIAEVLKISHSTVVRDWLFAKAWLAREIKNEEH